MCQHCSPSRALNVLLILRPTPTRTIITISPYIPTTTITKHYQSVLIRRCYLGPRIFLFRTSGKTGFHGPGASSSRACLTSHIYPSTCGRGSLGQGRRKRPPSMTRDIQVWNPVTRSGPAFSPGPLSACFRSAQGYACVASVSSLIHTRIGLPQPFWRKCHYPNIPSLAMSR
jgi:hypothetical protein